MRYHKNRARFRKLLVFDQEEDDEKTNKQLDGLGHR